MARGIINDCDFNSEEIAAMKAGREPMPAGTYPFEVAKATMTETGEASKQPGSPKLNLMLEVDDSDTEYAGRKVFANLVFPIGMYVESMGDRFLEAMAAFGFDTEDGMAFGGKEYEEIEEMFAGLPVKAAVKVTEFEGRSKNEVSRWVKAEEIRGSLAAPKAKSSRKTGSRRRRRAS